MKACSRGILVLLLATQLPVAAMGQKPAGFGNPDPSQISNIARSIWRVAGKVKTFEGDPVRGAAVMIAPSDAGPRVLITDAHGEFSSEFDLTIRTNLGFTAFVTAKKKGFQTAHAYANFRVSHETQTIFLTLRSLEEAPEQLSPAELIAGMAPRLRQIGPAEGLAAKSVKDYARAVEDALDHHNGERAVPALTRVVASNPKCIACRTMLGLAEIDWSAWDDAQNAFAESVRATQQDRQAGLPEPLVAYGTWWNWLHEPEKAEPFFREALKFRPEDPLALQELGRTLQLMGQYEAAGAALKRALAAGAGPPARLLYAEACLHLGRFDEASAEMSRYLDGRNVASMPLNVRQLWGDIQKAVRTENTYARNREQGGQKRLDFIQHPPADLIRGIEPAKDQSPLNPILDEVGRKVVEMVKSFPNTTADEAIHQEQLSHKGALRGAQDQKFRYLCLLPGVTREPRFQEYRADSTGQETTPKGLDNGFMLTQGFASIPLLFHPEFRPESAFRYLGRQNIDHRQTHVVAFAQLPGKARLIGSFQRGVESVPVLWQGLAWIDTDNYQIVRMRTDLLAPVSELGLDTLTSTVDFNEVHFSRVKDSFWLPGKVTVLLDWNGKLLRNEHAYSHFKIFNTQTRETIAQPKGFVASPAGPTDSTVPQ